ncbi:ankyrin repeat domain-containing protein [Legionella fairfieldensis]|uniref:ankyrin repeat domain-containing protein n=1 Tax=Legionella fairfieldensis TaxID=45064 RepID=UPI00048D54E6|nr:ankyrin repeat domain-containing protein [Legionella fairfieldensis]
MQVEKLFKAIQNNNLKEVKKCLEEGIHVDSRDEKQCTPLIIAISCNNIEIAKFLILNGADIEAVNKAGDDSLTVAHKINTDFPAPSALMELLIETLAIKHKFIEKSNCISASDLINRLITTLLYEANRHDWMQIPCSTIRQYIEMLDQQFLYKGKNYYERFIEERETEKNTFFGSYLSDDSDSDDERNFSKLNNIEKDKIIKKTNKYLKYAQVEKLTYQKKYKENKKGELKDFKSASALFELGKRTEIHYGKKINQDKIKKDLNELNSLLSTKTIMQAIDDLNKKDAEYTKFYVAEYRGITYLTTKWNQPSRKAHRQDEKELGKPQYSASVMASNKINFFRSYTQSILTLEQESAKVTDKAELLKQILLTLRELKSYSYNGYTYSNLADLLQNIYTQDYDGFHQLIKTHPVLKHILLNDSNPFVSMGDIPYHSAKYAYGIKPYKGHESFRLRPRWKDNGRAERPYSGVIYASLHPLTDYKQDGPLHLVSLNRAGEIKLKDELEIIPERESCFPSYLPEQRVFYKHIAKYPSFKEEYKTSFLHKYGLSKELYNKFKSKLKNARPHTSEMKQFKKLLGEWLCSYHEVKLIDIARKEAEKRGGVLIYRDINGLFSLTPPVDSVNRNALSITNEIKTPVKGKQKLRTALSPQTEQDIKVISDENSVDQIIDKLGWLSVNNLVIEPAIFTEGNNALSMPFSLLVSAIRNRHHLALRHYLTSDIFRKEINNTLNTYRLDNASLLHFAILCNDKESVRILLECSNINVNLPVDESVNNTLPLYYESLTPLHLALIDGKEEIILLLLENQETKLDRTCSFVVNKDLLDTMTFDNNMNYGENNCEIKLNPGDDGYDDLYLGSHKGIDITRTKNNTILHLAAEQDNPHVVELLIKNANQLINSKNSDGDRPLDLMLANKKYLLAAKLIRAGAYSEKNISSDFINFSKKKNDFNNEERSSYSP